MQFLRIEADNFKSFEKFDVTLDGHGFVKIEGINNTDNFSKSVGSGKSTIADALSYALTGETVKGNSSMSDVKNLYTKGNCNVKVTFIHNDVEYIISRGEVELKLFENGVDISKHLRRETQELISQMFPMFTPTFLGATVIIGQNMPNSFTNNKPSARKQILEELTNSSFMIEDIKQLLADRKLDWNSEVSNINTELVVLDSNINSNNLTIERSKRTLEGLQDPKEIQNDIAEFEEKIRLSNENADKYFKLGTELTNERTLLSDKASELSKKLDVERISHNEKVLEGTSDLLTEKSSLESELASFRSDINSTGLAKIKLENEIQSLKNVQTHCPTCKQALPDAHKIDTTEKEAELEQLVGFLNSLNARQNDALNSIRECEVRISKYKEENQTNNEIELLKSQILDVDNKLRELSGKINDAQSNLNWNQGLSMDLERKISALRVKLSEIDAIRERCNEDIKRSTEEIELSKSKIASVSKTLDDKQNRLSVLNQVISFASRDFRTILLTSIIKRLDQYAKVYCKKMLETTEIEFKDDGNNISITFRGRDFGVLSGGESQIVKMCITLALKKTLDDLVGFTTNCMFFDEILDNTDNSTAQQIIELISSLELGSTFFISHHEDVYLPIDKTWTVTKTNNISTLSGENDVKN